MEATMATEVTVDDWAIPVALWGMAVGWVAEEGGGKWAARAALQVAGWAAGGTVVVGLVGCAAGGTVEAD